MEEKRQPRRIIKGERTVGLLNTHTGLKHTNTTSALSFPANMSLETIMAVTLLIGLVNHCIQMKIIITCDLIGHQWQILITSQTQMRSGKKLLRKHSLHSRFLPFKMMWWTDSSTAWRDDTGKEMALGTQVQVCMFPGRAWDKEDTGSVWIWLMGVGWVVIVTTCSDGALDVRNMRSFIF